jgi:sodium-dependent dicarboxylate transporter 2/3/5
VSSTAFTAAGWIDAITWPRIGKRTQWGVLLLFGGGLALNEVMATSGASRFLAGAMTKTMQVPPTVLWLVGVASTLAEWILGRLALTPWA